MNKKSYYDDKKDSYQISGGRMREILKLVAAIPGRALDIGCGSGDLGQELKKRGWQVVGTDISHQADFCFDLEGEDWPAALVAQKFDLIVASEIIEHVFFPEKLLEKVKIMLSEKGTVIITTPNVLFWKNRLKMLFGHFRYENTGIMDFGHIRFFTLATARELFEKSGFQVEQESHVYPNLHHRGLDFLGRLFPGLFAYQMVFRLKK